MILLNKGITFANFHWLGKTPEDKEILEILSMTFTANDKRQDEIFFLPKHGET